MPFKFNPITGKLDLVSDLSGYVPYTGASSSLNLNSQQLIFQKSGAPFQIFTTDATFSGVRDDLLNWGYNIGQPTGGEPSLYFDLEANYRNGGANYMEHNFDYVNGATNKRYLHFQLDRSTLATQWAHYASVHYMGDTDGNNNNIYDFSGATPKFGWGTVVPYAPFQFESASTKRKMVIGIDVADATTAPTVIGSSSYAHLGNAEYNTDSYRLLTFGYSAGSVNNFPAFIGYQEKDTTNYTKGDLIFGTRDVTTDTDPTERMRIKADGNIDFSAGNLTTTGTGTFGQLDITDANTYLSKDGSNNLSFTDAVTGTKTLADLVNAWVGTATSDLDMDGNDILINGGILYFDTNDYIMMASNEWQFYGYNGSGNANYLSIGYGLDGNSSPIYGVHTPYGNTYHHGNHVYMGTATGTSGGSIYLDGGSLLMSANEYINGGSNWMDFYGDNGSGSSIQMMRVGVDNGWGGVNIYGNGLRMIGGSYIYFDMTGWGNSSYIYGSTGELYFYSAGNDGFLFSGGDLLLDSNVELKVGGNNISGAVQITSNTDSNTGLDFTANQYYVTMISSSYGFHMNGTDLVMPSNSEITDGTYTSIDPYNRALHDSGGTATQSWGSSFLTDHIGEKTSSHTVEFDNDITRAGKLFIDHIGEASSSHTVVFDNDVELDGALDHDGTYLSFFGGSPSTQSTGWSTANYSSDTALDGSSYTIGEVVDVLCTLIETLKGYGLLGS